MPPQDLRDRVALTTPLTRSTLKGWLVQPDIQLDLATGRVSGFIRFYDSTGAIVDSKPVQGKISDNRRNNLAADFVADIIAKNPQLGGVLTVESVDSSLDSPVANP